MVVSDRVATSCKNDRLSPPDTLLQTVIHGIIYVRRRRNIAAALMVPTQVKTYNYKPCVLRFDQV